MDVKPLLQTADEAIFSKMRETVDESLKNLTKQCFKVLHMAKRFGEIYNNGRPLQEIINKDKWKTWMLGFDNLNTKITRTFDDIRRHLCNILSDDQPYLLVNSKAEEIRQLQQELKTSLFPSDPVHLLTLITQGKREMSAILHQQEWADGKGHHVTSTNIPSESPDLKLAHAVSLRAQQSQPRSKEVSEPSVPGLDHKQLVETSFASLENHRTRPSASELMPNLQDLMHDTQGRGFSAGYSSKSPNHAGISGRMGDPQHQMRKLADVMKMEMISLSGVKESFDSSSFRRFTITQSSLAATTSMA
jgi:hypothetical protein